MEIDAQCLVCNTDFDAHWNVIPKPKCPKCGNEDRKKLIIHTNKDDDYRERNLFGF